MNQRPRNLSRFPLRILSLLSGLKMLIWYPKVFAVSLRRNWQHDPRPVPSATPLIIASLHVLSRSQNVRTTHIATFSNLTSLQDAIWRRSRFLASVLLLRLGHSRHRRFPHLFLLLYRSYITPPLCLSLYLSVPHLPVWLM